MLFRRFQMNNTQNTLIQRRTLRHLSHLSVARSRIKDTLIVCMPLPIRNNLIPWNADERSPLRLEEQVLNQAFWFDHKL